MRWIIIFVHCFFIFILSISCVFAAPTSAPFEMNGFGSSSDSSSSSSPSDLVDDSLNKDSNSFNTSFASDSLNSGEGEFDFQGGDVSLQSISPKNIVLFEGVQFHIINLYILSFVQIVLLLFVLILAVLFYRKESRKDNDIHKEAEALKSVPKEELLGYLRQHLPTYGFEAVKDALIQQGYSLDEIVIAYKHVTK